MEEPVAGQSMHAIRLRELGFTPDTWDKKMEPKEHLKGHPAFFMMPGDNAATVTFAVDETGQLWRCDWKVDLAPFGFKNMWHPVLHPLGFELRPDFQMPAGDYKAPAYFFLEIGRTTLTMALDEQGSWWQAHEAIHLSEEGFSCYETRTMTKQTRH
jgi:hypothetical protein